MGNKESKRADQLHKLQIQSRSTAQITNPECKVLVVGDAGVGKTWYAGHNLVERTIG
jgi:GTPase SAR1 family protein